MVKFKVLMLNMLYIIMLLLSSVAIAYLIKDDIVMELPYVVAFIIFMVGYVASINWNSLKIYEYNLLMNEIKKNLK